MQNSTGQKSPLSKFRAIGLAVLAISLAGFFALPGVASAQGPSTDVTIEGRGWLGAKGTGSVDITMGGRIQLWLDGDATITDHAGDMVIRTRGGSDNDRLQDAESGTEVILNDYEGKVHVRGSDFSVSVDGQVKFRANGKGHANLVGDGIYKTRRGERTVWDGMVEIGGTEVVPVDPEA